MFFCADCWLECSTAGCIHGVLSVCPTIRDEIHTWEPMPPCVANQICSICLSASHLPLVQQLPAWSCATLYGTHPRTQGHTPLHPNHIFLLHQIHFHDSLEQSLSTGGLWTKNGSQVYSDWMVDSRGKMQSAIQTWTVGSLETRINAVYGMSDYF